MNTICPLIPMDYPDPDIILVGSTYYMISTTMHFFPGGQILSSQDLIHWEIAGYVYDELGHTAGQQLGDDKGIYGKGMWAASLRFHKDRFYVFFCCYDQGLSYIFSSEKLSSEKLSSEKLSSQKFSPDKKDLDEIIQRPWERHTINGIYHDASILFDDDDKIYLAYGNTNIHVCELKSDMTGIKEDGTDKVVVVDETPKNLGYEGTHFIKVENHYILQFIHWPSVGNRRRTQVTMMADEPYGPYTVVDELDADAGFDNQGLAQGTILKCKDGSWKAVLFQDHGAVGRMPVLVPVTWQEGTPHLETGTVYRYDYHHYDKLYASDDFRYSPELVRDDLTGKRHTVYHLDPVWQWNHEPNFDNISFLQNGGMIIKTDQVTTDLTLTRNILTQRALFPQSSGEVTIDGTWMNEGDEAGICMLQGQYAMIGLRKEAGGYQVFMREKTKEGIVESFKKPYQSAIVKFMAAASFKDYGAEASQDGLLRVISSEDGNDNASWSNRDDRVNFYYGDESMWEFAGGHKLFFELDHFVGARFGLYIMSSQMPGGKAVFKQFKYSPAKYY